MTKRKNQLEENFPVKISTTSKKILRGFFWISIWFIISYVKRREILIVSPQAVLKRLFEILREKESYLNILNTFLSLIEGLSVALIIALILSYLSYKSMALKELIEPLIKTIKSIPVVSFIIFALMFFKIESLGLIISAIVIIPLIYINIMEGLGQISIDYIFMGKIFNVRPFKKFKYIYFESLKPYFLSSLLISLGFGFKSIVAAEVIGHPKYGLGSRIYDSKIYLDMEGLIAWTIIGISLNFFLEFIIKRIKSRWN